MFARGVSAELARRLLETGVVPAEEIYAALTDAVALGVPFVQALVTRGPDTADLVDRELGRVRGPVLSSVSVSLELSEHLPTGMCERLLAVPIGRSPSGTVEVAAVDPFDPAVGIELSHQLGAPVSVVRAPLGELLLALDRWLDERDRAAVRSTRTPAFGTRVVRRESSPAFRQAYRLTAEGRPAETPSEHQSWPPIPLVRRSIEPVRSRVDTNPGVGSARESVPLGVDETGTEVIGLVRSKVPPPPEPAPRAAPREPDLSELERAESADELVQRMAGLAAPFAERVIVLASRGRGHEARAAEPPDPAALGLWLAAARQSIVAAADAHGHFLGRLPDDELHRELRSWVGARELYAVPVRLGERVPLCLVLAGLTGSAEASRHADAIAARAGQVLERILRDRKRGG